MLIRYVTAFFDFNALNIIKHFKETFLNIKLFLKIFAIMNYTL